MTRLLSISAFLLLPIAAAAQDSGKIARLEQEVRQLQTEVRVLSQLVNQLRMRTPAAAPAPAAPLPRIDPATTSTNAALARWVSADRWQKLRPGMSELEVIGELGPPTAVRGDTSERVLRYALELAPATFLAGSVTLRNQVVTAIERPVLR